MAVPLLEKINHTAAGAGVFVSRAEHHSRNAGVYDTAGAHRAWLERDIDSAAGKPPVAGFFAGGAYGLKLGVSARVMALLPAVAPGANNIAVYIGDNAADGYLPRVIGLLCKRKRHVHVLFPVHSVPFKKAEAFEPLP